MPGYLTEKLDEHMDACFLRSFDRYHLITSMLWQPCRPPTLFTFPRTLFVLPSMLTKFIVVQKASSRGKEKYEV